MALLVGRVLHRTAAEGPFLRSAIWVHGCSIRCAGCINPHLFPSGGVSWATEQLAEEIIRADVEGVTLLGGEPFDQAEACADLAEQLRAQGLGIITFSGHEHEVLNAGPMAWRRLLEATDLLVDGPYRQSDPESRRSLVGSSNQRFIHLTDRYRSFDPVLHPNRLDVRISADGLTRMAGFLDRPGVAHMRGDGS